MKINNCFGRSIFKLTTNNRLVFFEKSPPFSGGDDRPERSGESGGHKKPDGGLEHGIKPPVDGLEHGIKPPVDGEVLKAYSHNALRSSFEDFHNSEKEKIDRFLSQPDVKAILLDFSNWIDSGSEGEFPGLKNESFMTLMGIYKNASDFGKMHLQEELSEVITPRRPEWLRRHYVDKLVLDRWPTRDDVKTLRAHANLEFVERNIENVSLFHVQSIERREEHVGNTLRIDLPSYFVKENVNIFPIVAVHGVEYGGVIERDGDSAYVTVPFIHHQDDVWEGELRLYKKTR